MGFHSLHIHLQRLREWIFYLLCWKIPFWYLPQALSRLTQGGSSQCLKSLVQRDQNGFISSKENMLLLILHLSMHFILNWTFVGTDEATTCVGLVIRNRRNGMTSVAHIDSPKIVEMGLSQMLSLLVDDSFETELDVHLIGGFEDVSLQRANGSTVSESHTDLDGYSFPLCAKIVHTLWAREEKFHIQTICVLGHNTRRDSDGNAYPFFNGFVVETTTGIVIPASFDRSSRCPDEIVRRIRVSASYEDTTWNGKLLETYDTGTDRFKIAPCRWTLSQYHTALSLQHYSDSEILSICSTSPTAEGPDFVDSLRRLWNYLIEHPHWTETFPKKQPRIFVRSTDGRWRRC